MKVVSLLSRWVCYLATGLLLLLMLLIVADVFMRFALGRPIVGTPEMARFGVVSLVLGAAWCALQGGHITVELVINRFPARVQAIVNTVTLSIGLVMAAIITWGNAQTALLHLKRGEIASEVFRAPLFPFYAIFVAGWFVLCLAMVVLIIQTAAGVKRRHEH